MARIGISGLFVLPGRVGGAEFMLRNLLSGISTAKSADDEIRVYTNKSWDISALSGLTPVCVPQLPGTNRFLQESLIALRHARDLDALLFPNYFTPPVQSGCPLTAVIHDLQYRHYPDHFSRRKRIWLRWAHETTLRRATHVVAISEFTRQDLLRHYGEHYADKIKVIRNPVSWDRFNSRPTAEEMAMLPDGPFILTVGSHYPWKNFTTLIRSFSDVVRQYPDLYLVIAGQVPERLVGTVGHPDLRRMVSELGLGERVRITGHITDAFLGELYRQARLFVFPSLFEGFGMPPIEALGMRLPVLTTRCGSLPEVTRGLARVLDNPTDRGEFTERVLQMLEAPESFAPSKEQAEMLRSYYSAEQVAQEYLALLRSNVPSVSMVTSSVPHA